MRREQWGKGRWRRHLLGGQGWFNRRGRPSRSLLAARHPPADEAYVRIWAARTSGLRGLLTVHCWLVYRRVDGEPVRWDVVGRRARTGRRGVQSGIRSARESWAANPAWLVHELRGQSASRAIPQLEAAIAAYPHRDHYCGWPGPNCNSFIAALVRALPELHTELPANAVGKDFLPRGRLIAAAPSGTGFQLSILGVFGLTVAATEGIELNLFGLTLGLDPSRPALKLPFIGRLAVWRPTLRGLGPPHQHQRPQLFQAAVRGRRPSIG